MVVGFDCYVLRRFFLFLHCQLTYEDDDPSICTTVCIGSLFVASTTYVVCYYWLL